METRSSTLGKIFLYLGCLALIYSFGVVHFQPKVEVYFSPRGGCTDAVTRSLEAARKSVYVQAYSFTSQPIIEALVACHKRHVEIHILLDTSDENGNALYVLRSAGIDVLIDPAHAIAHNKIMVIDGRVILTGSFNFTKSAEYRNAENLVIITGDRSLAATYLANWKIHQAHSVQF